MKRMLINATHSEEIRVALVEGQHLINLFIEDTNNVQKKGSIYKGTIARIEPSLAAAFVDYGSEKHGFLPFKDFVHNTPEPLPDNFSIKDALHTGQDLIIQVDKEERGNKGAAITNRISLAGSYLVLMPNSLEGGGISRRIEHANRDELRNILNQLQMPEGMSIIIRTAGVGRTLEELQWDLDILVKQWEAIKTAANEKAAPFLIYQESEVIIRVIRDYFKSDVAEIIIDDEKTFDAVKQYMDRVRPDFADRVKHYHEKVPLFTRFHIEKQIESAFQREVELPSGGTLVIDTTEALVAIDINSRKSTKGDDIESTAFNTNLEAANEIARQLRMRDLGGLIVIDFIDMQDPANQREVEERLRMAVEEDRARIQLGRISRFGLLEMSRQRLNPSLKEGNQTVCPRCSGQGSVRNVPSMSLSILRLVEEEAIKDQDATIQVHLPVSVATFLLNEKRKQLSHIEDHYHCHLVILPNANLETPNYSIQRIKSGDSRPSSLSFEVSDQFGSTLESKEEPTYQKTTRAKPAVKTVESDTVAPRAKNKKAEAGVFKRMFSAFFEKKAEPVVTPERSRERSGENREGQRSHYRQGQGQGGHYRKRSRNHQQVYRAPQRNDRPPRPRDSE
jgi:ribonuclease E